MRKINKWCIRRVPETADNINEWFSSIGGTKLTAKTDFHKSWKQNSAYWTYLHYPKCDNKFLHKRIINGYLEITFEEFKNNIRKQHLCLLKDKSGLRDYIIRK